MAKSKKSSTTTSKRAPKKAPSTASSTKVRRSKVAAAENRSPLKDVLIIAGLALGVFLIVNLFADGNDQGSGEEAVAPDEQSRSDDADDESDGSADDGNSVSDQANDSLLAETDDAYNFTVADGESYTTMARRAVASLDGDLSGAERVAAETKLAQDSGSAWLSTGQDLTLSKDDVRSAIDWAKSLDDQQKAAWQPYADMIAW